MVLPAPSGDKNAAKTHPVDAAHQIQNQRADWKFGPRAVGNDLAIVDHRFGIVGNRVEKCPDVVGLLVRTLRVGRAEGVFVPQVERWASAFSSGINIDPCAMSWKCRKLIPQTVSCLV
jgi:hypothetical protein